MTEQEALNTLKKIEDDFQVAGKKREVAEFYEGLSIAEKALEKQISKKPIIHPDNKRIHYCPSCNSYFGALVGIKHCMDCGQKLDWSE